MCRQRGANLGHLLCADSQGLIQDTCRVHAASYRLVRTLIVCSQELARTFVVCV